MCSGVFPHESRLVVPPSVALPPSFTFMLNDVPPTEILSAPPCPPSPPACPPPACPLHSPPSSRTWPLGVVLYYLGRYEEAAVRLDTDIRSFETQFEECATDERIWQVMWTATISQSQKLARALNVPFLFPWVPLLHS